MISLLNDSLESQVHDSVLRSENQRDKQLFICVWRCLSRGECFGVFLCVSCKCLCRFHVPRLNLRQVKVGKGYENVIDMVISANHIALALHFCQCHFLGIRH